MRLGSRIKELRLKQGLTQIELSEQTGLTERTIQRIENHEVEPSKFSLKKIGAVLKVNLNDAKQMTKQRNSRILKIVIWSISVLIVTEFILGVLTFADHWWVLPAWFIPVLSGLSIPYYRKSRS